MTVSSGGIGRAVQPRRTRGSWRVISCSSEPDPIPIPSRSNDFDHSFTSVVHSMVHRVTLFSCRRTLFTFGHLAAPPRSPCPSGTLPFSNHNLCIRFGRGQLFPQAAAPLVHSGKDRGALKQRFRPQMNTGRTPPFPDRKSLAIASNRSYIQWSTASLRRCGVGP